MIAPAKINLSLHITGQRNDGYHLLDSLIAFADYGDVIDVRPAAGFSFKADGLFAKDLPANDADNLSVKAAHYLGRILQKELNLSLHLTKNIPIGGGLGGGSSDAAATIKKLLRFWNTEIDKEKLNKILFELGADTPVCYAGNAAHVTGIGEIITPVPSIPDMPAILIYPNKFCSTAEIFKNFQQPFSTPDPLPTEFNGREEFYNFLKKQKNDLTSAALAHIPEIKSVLDIIQVQEGCALSRMSGSGSTCFGLFDTKKNSELAAEKIKRAHPELWLQAVTIKYRNLCKSP